MPPRRRWCPSGGRKPSSGRGQQACAADLRAAQIIDGIARCHLQRTPNGALGAGGCVCCWPQSGIVLAGGRPHQGGAGSSLAKRCCRAHQCTFHETHRTGGRPDRGCCRSRRRSLGRRDPLLRCWCQCPGSRQRPRACARGARALRERRNRRNQWHGESLRVPSLGPRWAGASSAGQLASGAGVSSVTHPGLSPARSVHSGGLDRSVQICRGRQRSESARAAQGDLCDVLLGEGRLLSRCTCRRLTRK